MHNADGCLEHAFQHVAGGSSHLHDDLVRLVWIYCTLGLCSLNKLFAWSKRSLLHGQHVLVDSHQMKHLLGPTDSTTLNNDAVQPTGPSRPVLEILGMVTEVELNRDHRPKLLTVLYEVCL